MGQMAYTVPGPGADNTREVAQRAPRKGTGDMDVARHLAGLGPIDPAAMAAADARAAWIAYRGADGWTGHRPLLTNWADNIKFAKTRAVVVGLSLAPHVASGHNVCRFSTPACRKGCVAYAGNGGFASVIRARATKTNFLVDDPQAFVTLVDHELSLATKRAGGARLIARLNTFSDIPWETVAPALFARHETIAFYDYTKYPERLRAILPPNYVLTQSASERTTADEILTSARNWAVVFAASRTKDLPSQYLGRPVIDGDKHDDRSADPPGVIVGLRAKDRMRTQGTRMVKTG